MMTRKPTIQTLLLLTLGITGSVALLAEARERPDRGPVSLSDMQIRVDERFNAIDVNNDELLSLEEYLAATPVGPTEGRPGHREGRRLKGRPHHGHLDGGEDGGEPDFDREAFEAAVFEAMDSDGDGALSPAEAGRDNRRLATRTVMRTSHFGRLDSNADGHLDRSEFNAPVLRLAAADSNADGEVSREEMRAARKKSRS